jgi:DNA-binding Lrp family transcriptional regulator
MLDSTDVRLLSYLQQNANATAQELGDALAMSASQASRRRQRLEADGIITGLTARLDPAKLGLTVQAFVQVEMATHSRSAAQGFKTLVRSLPEIVSCWTLTGEADYLLRVYCADLAALNRLVHDLLLPHEAVQRVQTKIVMDQIKADGPLPV